MIWPVLTVILALSHLFRDRLLASSLSVISKFIEDRKKDKKATLHPGGYVEVDKYGQEYKVWLRPIILDERLTAIALCTTPTEEYTIPLLTRYVGGNTHVYGLPSTPEEAGLQAITVVTTNLDGDESYRIFNSKDEISL